MGYCDEPPLRLEPSARSHVPLFVPCRVWLSVVARTARNIKTAQPINGEPSCEAELEKQFDSRQVLASRGLFLFVEFRDCIIKRWADEAAQAANPHKKFNPIAEDRIHAECRDPAHIRVSENRGYFAGQRNINR